MTKVLLTGGSGFIAAHVLDQLLAKGYTVITTVRSDDKARRIRDAYPDAADRLTVSLVPDIAVPTAFDDLVKANPDIDLVLHTASPFHYKWSDPIKELIDPALNGTTGILRALHAHAPSTKRVVVTSSFASILSEEGITDPGTVYTEDSWNPDGLSAVTRSPASAYRVSKKLAERAAWDFVAENKPSFDLVTVCPPLVLGPVADHLVTLDAVNTSNERVAQLLRGDWRDKIPPSGPVTLWVDVRDVARAHIAAIENPEAGGRRLFTVAGFSSNREIADIVRRNFPDYADRLPTPEVPGGEGRDPSKSFGYDSSRTDAFLKIPWINLETSISDLVKVFRKHGL